MSLRHKFDQNMKGDSKLSDLVEHSRIDELLDLYYCKIYYFYVFLFFIGDFSMTAKGISTKLFTQTADGTEQKTCVGSNV